MEASVSGLSSELEILFDPSTSALTRKQAEQRPAEANSPEAVGT